MFVENVNTMDLSSHVEEYRKRYCDFLVSLRFHRLWLRAQHCQYDTIDNDTVLSTRPGSVLEGFRDESAVSNPRQCRGGCSI